MDRTACGVPVGDQELRRHFHYVLFHPAASARRHVLMSLHTTIIYIRQCQPKQPGDEPSRPRPRLIKMTVVPRYGDPHVKDKTVARPSFLWHGDPDTGYTKFIYWDGPFIGSLLSVVYWAVRLVPNFFFMAEWLGSLHTVVMANG